MFIFIIFHIKNPIEECLTQLNKINDNNKAKIDFKYQ